MNEIPFGVEGGRHFGPVEVALRGGLTLNLIDHELTTEFAWYEQGSTDPVFQRRWVDPVHASAGITDVEIDVSSWQGRIGLGSVLG